MLITPFTALSKGEPLLFYSPSHIFYLFFLVVILKIIYSLVIIKIRLAIPQTVS